MTPGLRSPCGIKKVLDLPHQGEGRLAPFFFDKGGHVPAGAVFRLEGAVVLFDHQLDHFVHEIAVAHNLRLDGEILGEDKMEVAVQGVAEDDRLVVAVFAEQFLQIKGGVGQMFDGKGNILDDDGGAGLANGADRRKQALADLPQAGCILRGWR